MMVNPISYQSQQAFSGGADFAPLANLGNIYQKAQQEQADKQALAVFQQTGDPKALMASGNMSLAQLGINAQNHLDTLRQQGIENKRADTRLGFESTRAAHEKADWEKTPDQFATNPDGSIRDLYAEAAANARAKAAAAALPDNYEVNPDFGKVPDAPRLRPVSGGPADPEYLRKVAEAKRVPGSDFDDETIADMAKQARAGDTSVFTNIGKGAQGPENLKRLRQEITRQNREVGDSGTDQAMRNAEFMATKAAQRTLGTKSANIELAATEFKQVLPVIQDASKAVSRTNYPDLNKILLAGAQRSGDPNVVKLGGGVNTLINLYARAISPSGTPTVSDKEHAREILNAAWSNGQFDAAVGMMQQEIDAALASPEKVRDEMRKRFLGGQGGTNRPPPPAPSTSAGASKAVPFTDYFK